jgi:acyl carrier protein
VNNPFAEADLIAVVQRTLVSVLGCTPDEVAADVAIANDLDADSLDFVELRFNLEKQLGIVLPQKSVLDHLVVVLGDESQVYANGGLTELAAHTLRESFFNYSSDQVSAGMLPHEVMGCATVRNWANLCKGILDGLPARCADCGQDQAEVSPSGKPVCAACGAPQKARTGDDAVAASIPGIVSRWMESRVAA